MKSKASTKVIFYRVLTAQNKLSVICAKVSETFFQNRRILISVPNQEAADYIDQLIWKSPQESFVPHQISGVNTSERVVIAINPKFNLNQADTLFNLTPSHPIIEGSFEQIFELLDETHPEKAKLSIERINAYKKLGIEPLLIEQI